MSFEVKSYKYICSNISYYKNDDCTICRQSLNEDSIYAKEENKVSDIVTSNNCGHCFHVECINPWLKKYNKCPICTGKWN